MKRVLILEDEKKFGLMLKMALDEVGYETRLVADATAALLELENAPADLLVADIIVKRSGKPIADGGIKAIFGTKSFANKNGLKLKVLAISGAGNKVGMKDLLRIAKQVGADATLRKPFSMLEFVKAVDETLAEKA